MSKRKVTESKQVAKKRSKVAETKTTDEWEARFAEFQKRVRAHVEAYIENKPNMRNVASHHLELAPVRKIKFAVLQATGEDKITNYFAAVDLKTGDVFHTVDGRVTAKAFVQGNLFDEQYGAGRLVKDSLHFPAKPPKKPSAPKKKPATIADPSPFLGRIFSNAPCYREADYLRVIGWTKSQKTVLLEAVPLKNGLVDQKWLQEHPVTKPLQRTLDAPNGTAILRPSDEDEDEQTVGFFMDDDFFGLCSDEDLKTAHSFCEY